MRKRKNKNRALKIFLLLAMLSAISCILLGMGEIITLRSNAQSIYEQNILLKKVNTSLHKQIDSMLTYMVEVNK